ncbi:MAG: hypothetical protein ABIJ39_09410 [Chloroflexota bacterium]
MTKRDILICDDSEETGRAFKNGLERIDTVKEYFGEPILAGKTELEQAIEALERRLKQASNEEIDDYPLDDAAKIIDDAAILVIDYALFDLDASVTGERVAYLARCYSRCGIIIALNQFPPYVEEYFDLTLRGHLESYADLNIPSNSLKNPGLWSEPWNGFRPWGWPLLPQAVNKLEDRVTELQEHLGEKILEFLGFEGVKALTLTRSTVGFLSREKPEETIFRKFVDSAGSGNGLRGRNERPINDEAIARIAAARIGCWLEYDVLPGQNILVDAPHLISRFPSLLGDKSQDIDAWSRTASFSEPNVIGLDLKMEPYRFKRSDWLSRSTWFWNDLSDSEEIAEVRDPWSAKTLDYVFGEDISKFIPNDDARSFVADLESPFVRRYVKYLEPRISYTPLVRFSL